MLRDIEAYRSHAFRKRVAHPHPALYTAHQRRGYARPYHSSTERGRSMRERLLALGADVERAWHSAGRHRRPASGTLIEEIIVRVVDDTLDLVVRWAGGDHT